MTLQCRQAQGSEDDRDERRKPRGAGRGRRRSGSVATRKDLWGTGGMRNNPRALSSIQGRVRDDGITHGYGRRPIGVPHGGGPWQIQVCPQGTPECRRDKRMHRRRES
eukprot:16135302-Heterocapsa_arctica.AAC.1